MLTKLKALAAIFVLWMMVGAMSGCVAVVVGAAAGAGGVIWANGALRQDFNFPLYKVHEAALEALKKLDLPIDKESKDGLSGVIESAFSDGQKIKITLKHLTKDSCQIAIRIGAIGNEVRSREILGAISRELY
jgi:uncharacterized protein YceK